jgi:hypothetical protein
MDEFGKRLRALEAKHQQENAGLKVLFFSEIYFEENRNRNKIGELIKAIIERNQPQKLVSAKMHDCVVVDMPNEDNWGETDDDVSTMMEESMEHDQQKDDPPLGSDDEEQVLSLYAIIICIISKISRKTLMTTVKAAIIQCKLVMCSNMAVIMLKGNLDGGIFPQFGSGMNMC